LGLDVKEGFESLCDLCDVALQLSHPGLSLREIGGVSSHGLLENWGVEGRQGRFKVAKQLSKIFQRSSYADLLAWVPSYLQSTKEREFFCKGNLTIRVQRLNTCKGKPKCKITKLKQKKDSPCKGKPKRIL
jgi:hypothetical protein